jgi:hypothetical protein
MSSHESDFQEPPLRLTVEGMRWMGDGFEPVGTSGVVDLYGTDVGGQDAATVLRALRRILAQRLALVIAVLSVSFADLDFDAPNAPTEEDVIELLGHAQRIVADLEALRELSPEVVDDDDDDDDGQPREPDPSGAEAK